MRIRECCNEFYVCLHLWGKVVQCLKWTFLFFSRKFSQKKQIIKNFCLLFLHFNYLSSFWCFLLTFFLRVMQSMLRNCLFKGFTELTNLLLLFLGICLVLLFDLIYGFFESFHDVNNLFYFLLLLIHFLVQMIKLLVFGR